MGQEKQEIVDNKDGTYKVLSSDGKKYYAVTSKSCDCVGFRFKRTCRHIQQVLEIIGNETKELKFDRDEYDYLEFIDKFGGGNYDKWLNDGVIMRKGDRVRIV